MTQFILDFSSFKISVHNAIHYSSSQSVNHLDKATASLDQDQQEAVRRILAKPRTTHQQKKDIESDLITAFTLAASKYSHVTRVQVLSTAITSFLPFKSYVSMHGVSRFWAKTLDTHFYLKHLPSLDLRTAIDVQRYLKTDSLATVFDNLKHLTSLSLSCFDLSNEIVARTLSQLPELRSLCLTDCQPLSDLCLQAAIPSLHHLESFILQDSYGISDALFKEAIPQWENLREINLDDNPRVTYRTWVVILQHLPRIQYLDFREIQCTLLPFERIKATLAYEAVSPLGRFHKAILLQEENYSLLDHLFLQLSEEDREQILGRLGIEEDGQVSWSFASMNPNRDLQQVVTRWIIYKKHSLQPQQKDRIDVSIYRLAGSPHLTDEDGPDARRWGVNHSIDNLALLADLIDAELRNEKAGAENSR